MFNTPSRTIAAATVVRGRGLHGGEPVTVQLRPLESGAGLVFVRGAERVRTGPATAHAGPGFSAVGPVRTVEHLLAATLLRGVTDLEVVLDGDELPGLDGSALPWLEALGEPVQTGWSEGVALQAASVRQQGGEAVVEPHDALVVTVEADFGPPYQACCTWDGSEEVAAARTFALHRDLPALADRGHGLDEVLILGPRGPLVPTRSDDEWLQHKLLDLLGDLALVGRPIRGRVRVARGSHRLHLALIRACVPPPSRSG